MSRNAGLISVVALLLIAIVGGGSLTPASAGQVDGHSVPVGRTTEGEGWTGAKSMARAFVKPDGSLYTFDNPDTGRPYTVRVSVDHTQNLRGRERVGISWSGAQPSGGRSGDPYGDAGINQEYPVVILQCRGTAATVQPETCWTTSAQQRSVTSVSRLQAGWTHDADASDTEKQKVVGLTDADAKDCTSVDQSGSLYSRVVPFLSAKGKRYAACDQAHMPPEAAVGAAFPPADMAAFTGLDGKGQVQFEVRSDAENESLGCNQKVACSIVVIPVMGLSCDNVAADPGDTVDPAKVPPTLKACQKGGQFLAGSDNYDHRGVDTAVSTQVWWSPSVWKNRFVVPITFGPPPDTCELLDKRAPTGFFGSELLGQAALQWSPAYCLRRNRFKFQFNVMPDEAGWNLMTTGGGAAAEVSSEHETSGDPVAYAPTALTGFGIGYVIDRPHNAGEYTQLRLTPRLVAKLLTQSYPASSKGVNHPGLSHNPVSLLTDPEFTRLNPGLSGVDRESSATLLSLSNSSDLIEQLTAYIADDEDAVAFIAGKPDPWGMRVNPSYRKLKLPRADWPLLDTYVPPGVSACEKANPQTYLSQVAAPVTTLVKIAEALLDGWPNVQTRCDTVPGNPPLYKLGRGDRQGIGTRFVLGVVSLGDAARYGLRTAALETRTGKFVAPSDASISKAVGTTEQDGKYGPFPVDVAAVKKANGAYPGAMVVYTAARRQNLAKADAAKVAQFIRISSTEGQRPGSGNGRLPRGFVPIRKDGATARLWKAAQAAADAIEKQAEPPAALPGVDKPAAGAPGGSAGATAGTNVPPTAPAPAAAPPAVVGRPAAAAPVAMPDTKLVSGGFGGGWLLPLLLTCGVLAGVATAITRLLFPAAGRRR